MDSTGLDFDICLGRDTFIQLLHPFVHSRVCNQEKMNVVIAILERGNVRTLSVYL